MRILWSSNAIWACTGYGVQAKHLLPRFVELGHEVAQFAWYGLRGAKLRAAGITLYPAVGDPWGTDVIGAHVKDFKADVVISLQDIWVLPEDYRERVGVPWVCWFPVDQEPAPPKVVERAKTADYPVVYSRFALEQMEKAGLTCHYIPHGVNVEVYRPEDKVAARRELGLPETAFVAGMVAANKGYPSRKAFPENLEAFARFAARRKDLDPVLYLHTDKSTRQGGVDLVALAEALGIRDRVYFVDQYYYHMGLPEEQMAVTYNAFDVLLAASMGEGFGIPIVEAQACGVPVIVTRCSSMPELVYNGLTVQPVQRFWTPLNSWAFLPSVDGIVEALEAIAARSEQDRQAMAKRGRDAMVAFYSWDVCVDVYWQPFLEQVEEDVGARKASGPCGRAGG